MIQFDKFPSSFIYVTKHCSGENIYAVFILHGMPTYCMFFVPDLDLNRGYKTSDPLSLRAMKEQQTECCLYNRDFYMYCAMCRDSVSRIFIVTQKLLYYFNWD